MILRDYPLEFNLGNETFAMVIIAYSTNTYFELIFKSYTQVQCINEVIVINCLIDIIRFVGFFVNIHLSQRLVYHGLPPPPADCLKSLDIIMISSVEFTEIFRNYILSEFPHSNFPLKIQKGLEEFDELLKAFARSRPVENKRGSFSAKVKYFYPVYLSYKNTVSYKALKRKMVLADRVIGRMYVDNENSEIDEFCGNVDEDDGTIKLGWFRRKKVTGGVIKDSIRRGRIKCGLGWKLRKSFRDRKNKSVKSKSKRSAKSSRKGMSFAGSNWG